MAVPRIRNIQPALNAQQVRVEQAKQVQGKTYQVYGRVDFQGAGESTFDVSFPVWFFIDSPQLSFGAELGGNQALTTGNFPRVNVMVRSWVTSVRNNVTYYSGAQFILVAEGPTDMTGTAHWQVEGTGLTNPLTQ
jgi:hypothetical protein